MGGSGDTVQAIVCGFCHLLSRCIPVIHGGWENEHWVSQCSCLKGPSLSRQFFFFFPPVVDICLKLITMAALGLSCSTMSCGVFRCSAWTLYSWCMGSVMQAQLLCDMWCQGPRLGIEPASPALRGRLSTFGPPENSLHLSFKSRVSISYNPLAISYTISASFQSQCLGLIFPVQDSHPPCPIQLENQIWISEPSLFGKDFSLSSCLWLPT